MAQSPNGDPNGNECCPSGVLGQAQLNVFMNDLDHGIEYTLSKFVE